jgi:hypothetical protein
MAALNELVSVLTPTGTTDRVNEMVQRVGEATGLRLTKSDIYRAAIERGLRLMAMGLGDEERSE